MCILPSSNEWETLTQPRPIKPPPERQYECDLKPDLRAAEGRAGGQGRNLIESTGKLFERLD